MTPSTIGVRLTDLARISVPTDKPGAYFEHPEIGHGVLSELLTDAPVTILLENPAENLTREVVRKKLNHQAGQIDMLGAPKMGYSVRDPDGNGRKIVCGTFYGSEEQLRGIVGRWAEISEDGGVSIEDV